MNEGYFDFLKDSYSLIVRYSYLMSLDGSMDPDKLRVGSGVVYAECIGLKVCRVTFALWDLIIILVTRVKLLLRNYRTVPKLLAVAELYKLVIYMFLTTLILSTYIFCVILSLWITLYTYFRWLYCIINSLFLTAVIYFYVNNI